MRVDTTQRRIVVFCALALAAVAFAFVSKRIRLTSGPPLPAGKVQPALLGNLLHAPDGSLWHIEYTAKGGAASPAFTTFLPGKDWAVVSGSELNGAGIKDDGTLWLWSNDYNPGGVPILNPPSQVGNDRDWKRVKYGWNCALLLKNDGSMWLLGGRYRNWHEGYTPLDPQMLPEQIGSDQDWEAVETTAFDHYALKKDRTLWHWEPGKDTLGLLGEQAEWTKVTASGFSMTALKADGSVWIHGSNLHIVTRDATRTSPSKLVRVGTESDWVDVVAGSNSFIAKKPDGSWWATGENHYAHLGLPHWFGHSKHVARLTRIPHRLDVWAWQIQENSTIILTRDGSFYYMGKRPGSTRHTGGGAALKSSINGLSRWVPGMPPLFARPGEDWSEEPIRIGDLPPSVTASLRRTQ